MTRIVLRGALLVLGLLLAGMTAASEYPAKPVKLVVGYAPGGGADTVARIVAQALSDVWQQQVVVFNQPGASGMIAANGVVHATPDGYTLLLGYTPEVSINKLLFEKMSYDPQRDLEPIAMVASAPLVLVAGPSVKAKSLAELQRSGGELTFASPGSGSQQHLAGELLSLEIKVPMRHVPYKSGASAVQDVVGGRVDLFFATPPLLIPLVGSGRLAPLFVASDRRLQVIPTAPSASEAGLPGFSVDNWFAIYGPKAMSPAILHKIHAGLRQALGGAGVAAQLGKQGFVATYTEGPEFDRFVAAELIKYGGLIKKANVRLQ